MTTPNDPANKLEAVIRQQLEQWQGHKSYAWAGECGFFADYAWRAALLEGLEVSVEGVSQGDDFAAACGCPPGLSASELGQLAISASHVWLQLDGQFFDAASPQGTSSILELRCIRQTLVEELQAKAPARLAQLLEHPWWQESLRLLQEFLSWESDREQQWQPN